MIAPEDVSILIVNFEGFRHLGPCLTALKRQSIPYARFETILVDNASRDASLTLIQNQFPWVKVIASRTNLGFAEGNNVAARQARGTFLVLLNNDTIADPYWLEELLRVANERPGTAVASKLVFASDPTVLNSTGLFLLRDGRGADRGFRMKDTGQFERCEPVFAGCGAAFGLPAPPKGVDLFPAKLFLYYEDLDLGRRLRLEGKSIHYAPRSLVLHVHGGTSGETSALFQFHVERNRALTALRLADPFGAFFTFVVLVAKAVVELVKSRGRSRVVLAALVSYWRHFPETFVERRSIRSGVGRCV